MKPIRRTFREHTLSWSQRRDRLFRKCPRWSFYHYYGAVGGFDRGAEAVPRMLDYLRKTERRDSYCEKIFAKALHRSFYEPTDGWDFAAELMALFSSDKRRMFAEDPHLDHSVPHFAELLDPAANAPEFLAGIGRELRKRAEAAERAGFARKLSGDELILFRPPVQLDWMELQIHFAPAVIARRGRRIVFLQSLNPEPQTAAVIHKKYAMNHLGTPPENVTTIFYDSTSGETFSIPDAELAIGESMARIRASFNAMASLVRPDGTVCEEDFDKKTGETCNFCPFAGYCSSADC